MAATAAAGQRGGRQGAACRTEDAVGTERWGCAAHTLHTMTIVGTPATLMTRLAPTSTRGLAILLLPHAFILGIVYLTTD